MGDRLTLLDHGLRSRAWPGGHPAPHWLSATVLDVYAISHDPVDRGRPLGVGSTSSTELVVCGQVSEPEVRDSSALRITSSQSAWARPTNSVWLAGKWLASKVREPWPVSNARIRSRT